ncbi:glutamyl-tRNA(Gln) amidotransferase subunit A, mitochondrial-like [Tigriopus californicus]|uniref:glutamyl-tRNA(Gln) amidotransferase subunit A, mitochondrial-like n=1 Tax=Tigriopus californicus TaxID=6832 RepID=UPI0027DAAF93|nr:glutamyl-tRNA(Gln) amidotransferase subunit A, mitochondrial-like [Tigriopus californicus]
MLPAIIRPKGPPRYRSVLLGHGLMPSDLMQRSLEICDQITDLNAFTSLRKSDDLKAEAKKATRRWRQVENKSPIDGMTIAVKDNFCWVGHPTTCGSRMLQDFVPTYNATVVQKLVNAGAIILGKTNMDEFGMGSGGTDSIFGPTKNWWRSGLAYEVSNWNDERLPGIETGRVDSGATDDWFISGGSSGGSAVAVASGACFASLGSDTGGSVRIPGAWHGLVTLKPTYGSLSRHGLIPLVNSMDVPGVMAKSVEDVQLVFGVIRGVDPMDSTTVIPPFKDEPPKSVEGLKIGIPQEYHCDGMSEEVLQTWSDVADVLENAGAQVKQVSLPHTPYSIVCYSVLNPSEVSSNMARYDGLEYGLRTEQNRSTEALFAENRHLGFNEVVRGRILSGNYFLLKENYQEFFGQALKVRRLVQRDFVNVWSDDVDLLLTPVTLTTSPTFREFSSLDNRTQTTKQDHCTQPANLAGLPALTIPVKLSESSSLPLSVQLIGPRFSEDTLFNLGTWLEKHLQFPNFGLTSMRIEKEITDSLWT